MADLLKDITGGNIALAVVLALFWWRFEQSQRSGQEQKEELKSDMADLKLEVEKHTTELKEEINDIRKSGHTIYQKMIEDNRTAMKDITTQITSAFERIIDRLSH